MISKRRELFKNEGRTDRWHSFKEKISKIVKECKSKYYSSQRNKYLDNKDPRKFFAYTQSLFSANEHQDKWDIVCCMAPEKLDKDLADDWLTFSME